MRVRSFAGMAFALGVAGAAAAADASPPANAVRISVHGDASISVDGQPSSLDALDRRLAAAASAKGMVMYWRDDPNHDPSPAVWTVARSVLDVVVKYRLPICFSVDTSFSGCRDMSAEARQ